MKASETDMSQHAGYAGENAGIPHRRTLQLSKNPPAKTTNHLQKCAGKCCNLTNGQRASNEIE